MYCYHCGKGVLMGRTHTHHRGVAGGRWKKRAPKVQRAFYPNLQVVHIIENGKEKRVKLCTKCLKRIRKDIKDGVKPFVVLAANQPKKLVPSEKSEAKTKKEKTPSKKSTE